VLFIEMTEKEIKKECVYSIEFICVFTMII